LQVISHTAREIYFASGAFRDGAAQQRSLTSAQRKRFYGEVLPILNRLTSVGLPAIAHTLLETFESFLEFDPPGVFLQVTKTVRESRAGGYQYESMAVDLIVRIVKRYLAEYRAIFQSSEECRRALV